MAVFECINLTKQYGSTTALDDVTLHLEAGRIVGLLGPNGSGKTTLIKLATRLLQPTNGSILIDGEMPSVDSKSKIAYLPDREYLPLWMKIDDLVEFYKDFYPDFDEDRAISLINDLGIDRTKRMKQLSKGTKEKVQLILTMSRKAKIYILDEPIAGVDPAARDYILKTIISNYDENALVIISTHLIQDVEQILDEAVFIKQGKVILHESTDEIRNQNGMSVDAYFREVFAC